MVKLKEGMAAPSFEGTDQEGRKVRLSDFTGKKLVLYFYPKDNTSGCTAEACNLRDNHEEFLKKGSAVVGVSTDSEKSHRGFADKRLRSIRRKENVRKKFFRNSKDNFHY